MEKGFVRPSTSPWGDPQGEVLGLTNPFSISSTNCFFNSSCSIDDIQLCLFAIGVVPGNRSITNSTSRSGGNPGNSSGNTSMNSQTTGTLSTGTPSKACNMWAGPDRMGTNSTSCPLGCLNLTERGLQVITPQYLVSQSMPKITSIPWDSRIVKSTLNSSPPIRILTPLQPQVQWISPSGELLIKGLPRGVTLKLS